MVLLHDRPIPINHLALIALLFAVASVVSYQSGLDLWVSEHIYHWEGGNGGGFPLYDNYWTSNFMHDGGRMLVRRITYIVLLLAICSHFVARLQPSRGAFWYLLLAGFSSAALVSSFKNSTTLPCPMSLQMFGGDRPWVDFWQIYSSSLPLGRCYPAGHASGGYAWLCLAFVFPFRSRAFYLALLPPALLGLAFGVGQELRGAHFISHDLMTIGVCWLCGGLIYRLLRWGMLRNVAQFSPAQTSPQQASLTK